MLRTLIAFGLLATVLGFAGSPLKAQDAIHMTQTTTVTIPKKSVVEQNMQLSESQSTAFWSLYDEYEVELDQVHQKLEDLIRNYAKQYRALTDADAEKMLTDYFSIEKEKIAIREKFVPRFKAILSARQVTRLYQIENKFDAIIRFGFVDQIPLVNAAESVAADSQE